MTYTYNKTSVFLTSASEFIWDVTMTGATYFFVYLRNSRILCRDDGSFHLPQEFQDDGSVRLFSVIDCKTGRAIGVRHVSDGTVAIEV